MAFPNFPFGGPPAPKKVETTLENLLKEDTWEAFHPLGDWAKTVPQLLNTIWTSKNAEEVQDVPEKIYTAFLMHQQQLLSQDPTDEDQAVLLCEFLVEVIRFCWPILKSDALFRGKLFKAMHIAANELEIPSDDPWGGPPSPVRALSKATEFLDVLLANAEGDLDLLQCCAMASIRTGTVSSTDNQLMDRLTPHLTITDDATRACFVYAAAQLAKGSFFVDDERKKHLAEVCQGYLSLPDVSLTKVIAALVTAQKQTNQAPAEVIHILADYVLHSQEYQKIFDTTPLGNLMHLAFIIPAYVSALPPTGEIFFTRLLENLKTVHDKADVTPIELTTATVVAVNFGMKEPIMPGMKVFDLPAYSVALLKTLAELDKIWTNEKAMAFLTKRGVVDKESLVKFLADNADDGKKRFPKFAGLDQIPWNELGHAYGDATDIPDLLRQLASADPQTREEAQRTLYTNIYHQGTTYTATPYAVPYLIEMLECTLVQDKANIIQYCVYLLASFTEGFFCKKTGFDVAVEYPLVANTQQGEQVDNQQHEDEENDNDNPYSGIKHDIEKHLVAGLPVLLNALHDTDDAKLCGTTAHLLAFLPRVADQSVPKLKERLISEKDSGARGSLLLALGMLLPRVSSPEECLQFFEEQWNQVKNSNDDTVKFCVAACVARIHLGQKPPKYALEELLKAVGNKESKIHFSAFDEPATMAMGLITVLKADDALPHIIQQFKNTKIMWEVLPVLQSMLAIAFRFEMESNKPILPATLKPEQLEVLQALADQGDTLWNFGNACNLLRSFHLPDEKDAMVMFIEKAKASKDVMEM